jgi:hypothetical protein
MPAMRELLAGLLHGETNGRAAMARPAATVAKERATGLTDAVLETVRKKPGVTAPELIDTVIGKVPSTSTNPRKNVASTYDFLLKRGRLTRREGRFYPVA